MIMPEIFDRSMLAPCGVNCKTCYKHLSDNKSCPGCFQDGDGKPAHCSKCSIKNCEKLQVFNYCYECNVFPCKQMKYQERSYMKRYQVSPIQNLLYVKNNGIEEFMNQEKEKWVCKNCNGIVSQHSRICSECKTMQLII